MLQSVVLISLAVYWLALGLWSSVKVKHIFEKYQNFKPLKNLGPKYDACIRDDFKKWNKQRIYIGCFTILPIKVLLFLSMIFFCILHALPIMIFGQREIINNIFTFYLNTYGKFVSRIICQVQQHFTDRNITTPIVISNHVNWFDIFYITMGYAPVSFLTKEEVAHWPVVGALARSRKCVFVKRFNEEARKQAKNDIKQRINQINQTGSKQFPLVIFPEGTTSNGKALLSFKSGAFENTSSITAFCLRYQCQNFDMGMDEIEQIEHLILMFSQLPKLIVKKIVFEPKINETSEQYLVRCRNQMAAALGINWTDGGYRDKQFLKEMREKKKDI